MSSSEESGEEAGYSPAKRFKGKDQFRAFGAIGGKVGRNLGDNKFKAQLSPNSRSVCKELCCRKLIVTGELRLGKQSPSLTGHAKRIAWYHIPCIFKGFQRASYKTKTITSLRDVELMGENLKKLTSQQKAAICEHIDEHVSKRTVREKHQRKPYDPSAPMDDEGGPPDEADFKCRANSASALLQLATSCANAEPLDEDEVDNADKPEGDDEDGDLN
ncbi:hypothetical protein M885DRAFT_562745 [Pelagophyceae sp. CCMP2097]|nr:hypothetical protein M885DRAFT_562745 [Pelagophyceae sp. CCMP2097]|mmetsp:Transcript_10690/g.35504  ORF Transcript_10690/g.35504 Transcript_10690/m.35504 type:complete len:217 (+) Transcript_10690:61-711(+)